MRLVSATVYALRIPFLTSVRHSLAGRAWSDSVVVRVRDADGADGFGEAAPRPYVTGETPADVVEYLAQVLWPAVRGTALSDLREPANLEAVEGLVPDGAREAGQHHAARGALELAIIDWALRRRGVSVAGLLPPRRSRVVYGGVIGVVSPEQAARQARWARLAGLQQIKVKVGVGDDVARVAAIREVLGPDVLLRVDANGAWTPVEALAAMTGLARCGVVSVE